MTYLAESKKWLCEMTYNFTVKFIHINYYRLHVSNRITSIFTLCKQLPPLPNYSKKISTRPIWR